MSLILGLILSPAVLQSGPVIFSLIYFGMMGMVVVVSWAAMILDGKIQQMISRNERVRQFLKS